MNEYGLAGLYKPVVYYRIGARNQLYGVYSVSKWLSDDLIPLFSYLLKNSNLFPQTSVHPVIGQPFIVLPEVDSSNNYAMAQVHAGLAKHGATWFALHQSEGKGQRGKRWINDPGMSVLMSIVLEPKLSGIRKTFDLSALVSLSCYEFFKKYGASEVSIKWPNDIYWRDRKAGGILIENIVRGSDWLFAVAGIGLNINQQSFDPMLPNPVSFFQITQQKVDVLDAGKDLCSVLQKNIALHQQSGFSPVDEMNKVLFRRNEKVKLKKGNITFETQITGVNESGQLVTRDNIERTFDHGEVEWL